MDLKPVAVIGASPIPQYPDDTCVDVTFPNAGVDRPMTTGVIIGPNNPKLVQRLVSAINDGVAFTDAEIKTDTNGKTYVDGRLQVVGCRLNADLKRLGY